ncbi:MAG: TetR family transcriptional regulator [Acidobacteria bacterium]|nr:TetR family transcriptional regulator [Acidobacteriota bacterium]
MAPMIENAPRAAGPGEAPRSLLVADAAIAVLAAQGSRGLTHRAVDQAAGIPEGSTSNLYRTRDALLDAVLERHVERELELIDRLRRRRNPAATPRQAAGLLAGLVREFTCGAGAELSIARYELFLEGRRRPAFQPALAAVRGHFTGLMAEILAGAGLGGDRGRAAAMLSVVDGFTAAGLFHGQAAPDQAGLASLLEAEMVALNR